MRAVIAPDGHALGTYLRVDELARRFDVSVDDVLAACSLLGFAATDAASLVEVSSFTEAVNAAPVVRPAVTPLPPRRRPVLLASAAALLAVIAAFGALRAAPSRPAGGDTNLAAAGSTRAVAAYQHKLQSTYEATVAEVPRADDYRALAERLAAVEPPAAYSAEHATLIAEAERVATLAEAAPECDKADDVPDCVGEVAGADAAAAAAALEQRLGAGKAPLVP